VFKKHAYFSFFITLFLGEFMSTSSSDYNTGRVDTARVTTLNVVDWIALILVIVGGLNWGLVGAFDFDLVAAIFGAMSAVTRIVYVLVGIAAVYCISLLVRLGK
jgi:uncharacterized protein